MPTRLHKLTPLEESQSADIFGLMTSQSEGSFGLQPAACSLQPEGTLASTSACRPRPSPATEEQPYAESKESPTWPARAAQADMTVAEAGLGLPSAWPAPAWPQPVGQPLGAPGAAF